MKHRSLSRQQRAAIDALERAFHQCRRNGICVLLREGENRNLVSKAYHLSDLHTITAVHSEDGFDPITANERLENFAKESGVKFAHYDVIVGVGFVADQQGEE